MYKKKKTKKPFANTGDNCDTVILIYLFKNAHAQLVFVAYAESDMLPHCHCLGVSHIKSLIIQQYNNYY